MLSVRAAAEWAGVCESIVYAWVEKKLLPHFRLGKGGTRGKIAIAEEDLDAFLKSRKVTGPEQDKPAPAPPPRIQLKNLRLG